MWGAKFLFQAAPSINGRGQKTLGLLPIQLSLFMFSFSILIFVFGFSLLVVLQYFGTLVYPGTLFETKVCVPSISAFSGLKVLWVHSQKCCVYIIMKSLHSLKVYHVPHFW